MADIAITAASVLPANKASDKVAGEALSIGDVVCKKDATVDGKTVKRYYGAQADVLADSVVEGIVIAAPAAAEQPLAIQSTGDIAIGGTTVVGTEYVLSAAKGKICPKADLVTGDYYSRIGIGIAGNKIRLDIDNTGLQIP